MISAGIKFAKASEAVAAGSLETMQYVARKRYAYMGIPYFHLDVFKRNFNFLISIASPLLWTTSSRTGISPATCRFASNSS